MKELRREQAVIAYQGETISHAIHLSQCLPSFVAKLCLFPVYVSGGRPCESPHPPAPSTSGACSTPLLMGGASCYRQNCADRCQILDCSTGTAVMGAALG